MSRRRLPRLGLAVWALLAVALVLRLGYVAATPDYTIVHDARDYDYYARSLARGEGYGLSFGIPTAFRPPGYIFLLAGVYDVAGVAREGVDERVPPARIVQAFIGTLAVALIGLIAAQLWGRRAALAALALGAVYLPLILIGGALMSEPLFVVLMLGSLAAAIQLRRSRHKLRLGAAGRVRGGPGDPHARERARPAPAARDRRVGTCGRAGRGARWRRRRCSSSSRSRPWRRGRSATPWSCTASSP